MRKNYFSLLILLLLSAPVISQSLWPAINKTAKPWTRWWWMGSAVDTRNLRIQLTKYADAGVGGVEIVPIYGAKGYESSYISYLSPKWMQMLDSTVSIAGKLGMGVDMTIGTGWPIGGPQVTTTDAASKLQVQQYKLSAGQTLTEKIIINDPKQQSLAGVELQALIAYGSNGEITDIKNELLPDGTLKWVAPGGEWNIYAAFVAKTLQKVKRAAPGGEGYTFDHFSSTALTNYFKKYDTAYANKPHGVRSYFNDSYEVFNANWSVSFFDEFRKRRGYDLTKYLREFSGNDSTELVARIKCDYRETMADLMLENFSAKFTSWAHSKNALSTNQAHGSPGNLLDLYAAVDIAETETFGSSAFPIPGLRRDSADIRNVDPDPVMMKFPSSAAHAIGHKLVSCETFTWLTEHFKTSWAQCKPEVEKIFLSGINHVFLHGTTYSPAEAQWPGWLFYASVNVVPNNSLWPHLKGLTNYISRCQAVLQSGKPDNELMIYWPVYDTWQDHKGKDKPLRIHNIDDWLQSTAFYKNVQQLQQAGYSMDFISDKMIAQTYVDKNGFHVTDSGATYKTLIVPATILIPLSTMQKIKELAQNGATIIFETLPEDVPGLNDLQNKRNTLAALIQSIVFTQKGAGIRESVQGKGKIIISGNIELALQFIKLSPEALVKTGLQFIKRKTTDASWYYIVNHTANTIDTLIHLEANSKNYFILDPQTGKEGRLPAILKNGQYFTRLQLLSGESVIIKCMNKDVAGIPAWKYRQPSSSSITLSNPWQVSFTAGGPVLPAKRTISHLSSWTEWNDSTLQNFSGTAVYTSSFDLATKESKQYILDLGKVCESAKVWINGKEAGLAWSLPYQLEIGSLLRKGRNEIKIEVVNLMANRIRYMDRNGISWRNYHEINFVNINYKDFNAAGWPLQPSGLTGPVVIKY